MAKSQKYQNRYANNRSYQAKALWKAALKKFCKEKKAAVFTGKKIDGDLEACTAQLACSEPPKGFPRWTLQMLAGKL